MKIYGVIANHNNMELVLSQTPHLLVNGAYWLSRMKKFLIKHRTEIKSIIIDHGAWTRYNKEIVWEYRRVASLLHKIMKFLETIGYNGEVIPIAPDKLLDSRTTINWQQRWLKDFSGESICVYRGYSAGYKYFAITKNPKPSMLSVLHLRSKGKLHGLGAKPKWMPFYRRFGFDSIDCTLDSNGWNKNRIEDFRSPIWEEHIRLVKKLHSQG